MSRAADRLTAPSMSRKRKPRRRKTRAEPQPKQASSSAAVPRTLRRRRRWLYRALAVTAVPAGLLLLLEGGLRLVGYGHPTGFTIQQQVNSRTCHVANPYFGWRFFPRMIARRPGSLAYPAVKDRQTYRIFVLGASAAQGDPDPAYGFSRILEAMLRDQYPQARFEVINTATTAINSHVVREIAAECAGHQPDLFIVYLGNNEVIGPFGPGNSVVPLSRSLALIRTKLFISSTRVGQATADLLTWAGLRNTDTVWWRGMEMFLEQQVQAEDPALKSVYSHFRSNLEDICRQAGRGKAPLILSTVAANLGDCAPFASLHRRDLTDAERNRWESLYREGIAEASAGHDREAVQKYQAAAAIDSQYAEVHYRLGHCYRKLEDYEQARESFEAACQWDSLRFRADRRVNEIIRAVAEAWANQDVHLVDAAKVLAQASPQEIPGRESFYEHVHLNFEGNYLLAGAVFEQVTSQLPERIQNARAAGPLATVEECARRLALTDYDRSVILGQVVRRLGRPPFTNQCDIAEQRARIKDQIAALGGRPGGEEIGQGEALYRRAIELNRQDRTLRLKFAIYLLARSGKPVEAETHLREALRLGPDDNNALHVNLAAALAAQRRTDQAIEHLKRAIAITPNEPVAHFHLGLLLYTRGKSHEAIRHLEAAIRSEPDYVKPLTLLAWALATTPEEDIRDGTRAAELAERACQLTDYQDSGALDALAAAYAETGRFADAVRTARKAIQLLPSQQKARIEKFQKRIARYEVGEPWRTAQ